MTFKFLTEMKKYNVVCCFTFMGEDFVKTGTVIERNSSEAIDEFVDLLVDKLRTIDKYLSLFKMNSITVQEIK